MAKLFGLDEETTRKLSYAALLHDITKEFDSGEHRSLCREYNIEYTDEEAREYSILHAKTGAALARKLFPDITDDTVYGCIRWHTTGRPDMTLPEKLIFLADYIEPKRDFDDCVTLRRFFYDKIHSSKNKYSVLDETLIISFDMTVDNLIRNSKIICTDTIKSRNFLIAGKSLMIKREFK